MDLLSSIGEKPQPEEKPRKRRQKARGGEPVGDLLTQAGIEQEKPSPPPPAEKPKKPKTSNLFANLDALWTKRAMRRPPMYVMHRFLASDPDLAIAARYLQQDLRGDDILFRVWQGILPRGREAPRLYYVAPKKPPQEEALVAEMMRVLSERREVVEEMVEILRLAGREDDLYPYFGVEPDEED